MKSTADKLVDDYLQRLERELAGFPRARRRELVEEISLHIAEARAQLETENEAAIRTLLDRLGDPADIAAEAGGRAETAARPRGSGWDVVALILWASATWTTAEKLVGTLVVPFGLALPAFLITIGVSAHGEACSGGPGGPTICTHQGHLAPLLTTIVTVALILASIGSVVFLARRRSQTVGLT
jgi:uncharacterized membrane protein